MSQPLFYHSGMAGAPDGNTRIAGGLLAVLDACLVNGFNSISVTGIVQAAGTATATTSGTHNFAVGDVVEVAGATPSAYNGMFVVLTKTSNTFTYAVDSGTASPATGTLTAEHPAAGWTKSWAGTNQAAYRSATSGSGMGHYVQVEDDNPYSDSYVSARVRLAEAHTAALDAATLLGEQIKISKLAGSTNWWLCADDRTCYMAWGSATTLCFGEIKSLSATDTYAFVLNRGVGASLNSCGIYFPSVGPHFSGTSEPTYNSLSFLKNYSGLTASALGGPVFTLGGQTQTSQQTILGTSQQYLAAVNPLSASVSLAPMFVTEVIGAEATANNQLVRGKLRGLWQPLGLLANAGFATEGYQRLTNTTIESVDRRVVVCKLGVSGATAQVAFDLTGPWG